MTPARRTRAKAWLRWAGALLTVVSLVFVAQTLMRSWPALAGWTPLPHQIAILAGLALAYALSMTLLAQNWHAILGLFGGETRRRAYCSFALTQIARYLPGNVVHLLGRAAYLRGGAISDKALGVATLVELALTPAGAVSAVLVCLTFAVPAQALPGPLQPVAALAPVLLGAGVFLGVGALVWVLATRNGPAYETGRKWAMVLTRGLVLTTLFMLALGAIFATILTELTQAEFGLAAAVAVIAWLAGYVTLGAPGGLGPREATLLILLADRADPAALVLAAVIFRLVTIAGDVLCFASGWLVARPPAGVRSPS